MLLHPLLPVVPSFQISPSDYILNSTAPQGLHPSSFALLHLLVLACPLDDTHHPHANIFPYPLIYLSSHLLPCLSTAAPCSEPNFLLCFAISLPQPLPFQLLCTSLRSSCFYHLLKFHIANSFVIFCLHLINQFSNNISPPFLLETSKTLLVFLSSLTGVLASL